MIRLESLIPKRTEFKVNDETFVFKPFSLAAQVWTNVEFNTNPKDENYNGLQVLSEKIMEFDVVAILKVSYYLLEDKSTLMNRDSFTSKFPSVEDVIKILMPALRESIGVSQPDYEELEGQLKKRNKR